VSRNSASGWRLSERNGILLALCEALERCSGVVHAFSTRRAEGRGDFDLGGADTNDAETLRRRVRFGLAAGLSGRPMLAARQVHGRRVVTVNQAAEGPTEADGIAARHDRRTLGFPCVRTADCVPILLADPAGRAVAAVHAGWRGTAAGIAGEAVRALARMGTDPSRLLAALGPAIGGCCYEVGREVSRAVTAASGGAAEGLCRHTVGRGPSLDLRQANLRQLERAGLPTASIHVAPWCTHCDSELFFSYRREGEASGRMLSGIGWSA